MSRSRNATGQKDGRRIALGALALVDQSRIIDPVAAATQMLRRVIVRQQPRPGGEVRIAIQRQPFGPGEVVVDPFQKGLEQVIGSERRPVGKYAPRLRQT